MARTIKVTPEELRSAAQKIESLSADYETQYNSLYREMDSMESAWQGKDNVSYIEQIRGFKDDFENMKSLMDQYATFLRNSAKAYDDTQNAITEEATKLAN
jgi:WXG100 family type VII secretion target